ncbi:enoyl-CoA delta isomerase 1, mitochondrial-like [Onthophagus taurus]|uniref:enoyl-CoA delta isomerase 1, mitochondrial-like n=1 Tax=Onthophagus taurus TaxID=166361 RepID=UPI0039BE034B
MALRSLLKPLRLNWHASARNYSGANSLVSVTINDKNGIATVSMDRKPVNGLNYELLRDLNKALEGLEGKAKGAILTSSLPTIFSGGLDIMEMYKPEKERVKNFWTQLQETWMCLFNTSYPTVAAINGHSPAGGCLLAMSCEYRVMVEKFTIGLNETKLGIVAPFWFIGSMQNTISTRNAELALTEGKLFTTEEALKIGLVDEIATNKEDALIKAEGFFKRFDKVNPLARQFTKTSLRGDLVNKLRDEQEEDLEKFLFYVFQPKVQDGLEKYMQALKKK